MEDNEQDILKSNSPLDYELVKVLAEGSYGKVILARKISTVPNHMPLLIAFKVFTMQVSEEEADAESEVELYETSQRLHQ